MSTCTATSNSDPDFPLACNLESGHDSAHLNDPTGEWWSDPLDEFRLGMADQLRREFADLIADDIEFLARRGGAS